MLPISQFWRGIAGINDGALALQQFGLLAPVGGGIDHPIDQRVGKAAQAFLDEGQVPVVPIGGVTLLSLLFGDSAFQQVPEVPKSLFVKGEGSKVRKDDGLNLLLPDRYAFAGHLVAAVIDMALLPLAGEGSSAGTAFDEATKQVFVLLDAGIEAAR